MLRVWIVETSVAVKALRLIQLVRAWEGEESVAAELC
jgi:hypothetical protein